MADKIIIKNLKPEDYGSITEALNAYHHAKEKFEHASDKLRKLGVTINSGSAAASSGAGYTGKKRGRKPKVASE